MMPCLADNFLELITSFDLDRLLLSRRNQQFKTGHRQVLDYI